jgi:hypothetical protein
LVLDEEAGDDVKIVGVYSTGQQARDSIDRARLLPGFQDEPECFATDRYTLDEDKWPRGFITVSPEGR